MTDVMTEWRDIPGYEGRYQVSSAGQVRSLIRGGQRILRPAAETNKPYLKVGLAGADRRRTWKVHQLVALTFHGPRPFPDAEVRHLDGNAVNNHVSNLRWGTKAENVLDGIRHTPPPTHCKRGLHELTPANTYVVGKRRNGRVSRACRTCVLERMRRNRSKEGAAA